jgi:hypothetical protein
LTVLQSYSYLVGRSIQARPVMERLLLYFPSLYSDFPVTGTCWFFSFLCSHILFRCLMDSGLTP